MMFYTDALLLLPQQKTQQNTILFCKHVAENETPFALVTLRGVNLRCSINTWYTYLTTKIGKNGNNLPITFSYFTQKFCNSNEFLLKQLYSNTKYKYKTFDLSTKLNHNIKKK
jgi:hypothetical protein